MPEFNLPGLANTLWSFATLRIADQPFMAALASQAISRLEDDDGDLLRKQRADATVCAGSLLGAVKAVDLSGIHMPSFS